MSDIESLLIGAALCLVVGLAFAVVFDDWR